MTRFERWCVVATSAGTAVTGVGYLWIRYFMEPVDPFSVINHPLQPWFLKAHILVSPFLLFAVGAIAVRHVWRHYRQRVRPGRRTGLATALSLLPMVLTGYLIQSVTHEGWLTGIALSHVGLGLLFTAGVALHYFLARRDVHLHGPAAYRQTRRIEGHRRRAGEQVNG